MEENMRKVLHRHIKAALTELDGLNFDRGMVLYYGSTIY